jgi:ABC-2 type transport system permease protein
VLTAFLALLRRDLHVAVRTAPLILGTLTQPILVVLVFGNLLPRLGLVAGNFGTVLMPGLMSITMMMAGVQGILMPLAGDLSGTREIDERLLAPITSFGVALEKILAGAIQAAWAGVVALPLMMLLMHEVSGASLHPRWLLLLPIAFVCGLLSAAFGLNLGTRVEPRYAGLLFPILLGPMMLFGCAYYPWSGLQAIGWLRYLFLINPLVFISEALRLAVTPEIPHMPLPLMVGGLVGFALLLMVMGARAFERRTIL